MLPKFYSLRLAVLWPGGLSRSVQRLQQQAAAVAAASRGCRRLHRCADVRLLLQHRAAAVAALLRCSVGRPRRQRVALPKGRGTFQRLQPFGVRLCSLNKSREDSSCCDFRCARIAECRPPDVLRRRHVTSEVRCNIPAPWLRPASSCVPAHQPAVPPPAAASNSTVSHDHGPLRNCRAQVSCRCSPCA